MKVLVACEESQAVTKELRKLGHKAYSCDILDCSGGHPEWHIKGDVLTELNKKWDMIIAFPPCTHLAVSGARWFEQKRKDGRQREGIEFFLKIANAPCDRIAIENPVGIMSGEYLPKHFPDLTNGFPRKPDQVIHPYQFGHEARKSTCLWLKNLPNLRPTNIVGEGELVKFSSGKVMPKWYSDAFKLPPEERAKVRSKTFSGIAKAMAEQWTKNIQLSLI